MPGIPPERWRQINAHLLQQLEQEGCDGPAARALNDYTRMKVRNRMPIQHFRKKDTVEALQYQGEITDEIRAFVPEQHRYNKIGRLPGIFVGGDPVPLVPGDWICKYAEGDYRVHAEDVMQAHYNRASPTPDRLQLAVDIVQRLQCWLDDRDNIATRLIAGLDYSGDGDISISVGDFFGLYTSYADSEEDFTYEHCLAELQEQLGDLRPYIPAGSTLTGREFLVKDESGRGVANVLSYLDIQTNWDTTYSNDPDDEFEETLGDWLQTAELGASYTHNEQRATFMRTK